MTRHLIIRVVSVVLGIVLALTIYRYLNPRPFELLEPQSGSQSTLELPSLWQIPDFTLIDRSGQPVTLAQLQGHPWVADFFYTSCPGPCPMLSSRFSDLQKALGPTSEVRLVSISSDPEKDTPEVLQKYAEHYKATDRWLFLTGDKKTIYDLANQGFKLSVVEDKNNPEGPIVHSTKLVLVDRNGTVRGVYDGLREEGKGKLLRDLHVLLSEGR